MPIITTCRINSRRDPDWYCEVQVEVLAEIETPSNIEGQPPYTRLLLKDAKTNNLVAGFLKAAATEANSMLVDLDRGTTFDPTSLEVAAERLGFHL